LLNFSTAVTCSQGIQIGMLQERNQQHRDALFSNYLKFVKKIALWNGKLHSMTLSYQPYKCYCTACCHGTGRPGHATVALF